MEKLKFEAFLGPKWLDKLKDDVPFWHFLEGFLVVLIGVVVFRPKFLEKLEPGCKRAREKGAKRKKKRGKEVATMLKS